VFRKENIMSDFKIDKKTTGLFAAGVLFGTAGIKILSSKDAKKLYTNCTAAVLRAKECVMKTVTTIQENAEDIYEDAKEINEERAAAEEVYEDSFDEEDSEEEATAEEENGDATEA
jgi:exonuclease I